MIRRIIKINEEQCNGCGICVTACHEGAIAMVDGKAKLIRDDYCDGLGDCLPVCPVNAISFEEREALEYDEGAVLENQKNKAGHSNDAPAFGCPGMQMKAFHREEKAVDPKPAVVQDASNRPPSQLSQWPVQIKLVSPMAPYLKNANLLIAADCTAYAYGDFHERFIKNKVTLIGCPKLDEGDYADKLTDILKFNDIKSVTVVRMEVPCCGGIVNAVTKALQNSEKMIPWQIVTISVDGNIIEA